MNFQHKYTIVSCSSYYNIDASSRCTVMFQGTMIHGKVMKHMVNKFRPLIQEGLVYMIANFKVMSAMNFRPVESEKVLNFLHTTKIQEIKGQKNIKIAEQSFTFCTVEVLSTRDSQKIYLSGMI